MLVSPTQNSGVGGIAQCQPRYFASQWNIGFRNFFDTINRKNLHYKMLKFGNTGKLYKIIKSAYDKNRYSITPFPPSTPHITPVTQPSTPHIKLLRAAHSISRENTLSKSCKPENAKYIQTYVCRLFHFYPVFPCKTPHSTKWYD